MRCYQSTKKEEKEAGAENALKDLNIELEKNYDKYFKEGIRNTHHSKSVVSWF